MTHGLDRNRTVRLLVWTRIVVSKNRDTPIRTVSSPKKKHAERGKKYMTILKTMTNLHYMHSILGLIPHPEVGSMKHNLKGLPSGGWEEKKVLTKASLLFLQDMIADQELSVNGLEDKQ